MKNVQTAIVIVALMFSAFTSSAYELWLGCTKIPKASIDKPGTWDMARSSITGTNLNLVSFNSRDADNPIANAEETMGSGNTKEKVDNWNVFFDRLSEIAKSGMAPIARTQVEYEGGPERPTIEERLESEFLQAEKFGYKIGSLMPYASKLGEEPGNPTIIFSNDDLRRIREWLDSDPETAGVKIITNLRLFNKNSFLADLEDRGQYIDSYTFEAAPEKFYEDRGNRQAMLETFINNPLLQDKDIIFQIPLSIWEYEDEPGATNYQIVRNFMKWLGDEYGTEWLQSDRVKFLITTYSPPIPFYPEVSQNERLYRNTQTGLMLSLIEQEPLFAGRLKNPDGSVKRPTKAKAYSYKRTVDIITDVEDDDDEFETFYAAPNPTIGQLTLSLSVAWRLFNLQGTEVNEGFGRDVDMGLLPNGIYVLIADDRSIRINKQ